MTSGRETDWTTGRCGGEVLGSQWTVGRKWDQGGWSEAGSLTSQECGHPLIEVLFVYKQEGRGCGRLMLTEWR